MPGKPIPLNLFGMPFGLAGLAGIWVTMAGYGHLPGAVGDALLAVAALAWIGVLAAYAHGTVSLRSVARNLTDPVGSPFASLAVVTPMLLITQGLYPHVPGTGRVLLDAFIVLTVLLGAWFTGQWIYGPLELDQIHPGYFLPTVAGGLIASDCAATVGQHRLAQMLFGLGVVCWLVLGSVILGRLLARPMPSLPLQPTLMIEVAPSAVASLAYFAEHGDRIDGAVAFLGGYGVLMVLAQLRLVPAYLRLRFMPSMWAFTFSLAAVATVAVHWLQVVRPAGYREWQIVLLVLVTAFIGAIAVRTGVAIARGQLLTAPVRQPQTTKESVDVPA